MLHVLDFEGNIIDFISKNDKALIDIKHERNIKDYTEILDITILASRAVKFKERNRVIFLDSRNEPREFIINRIEQDSTSKYSLIECNASYLEDIATAAPYPPQKLEKMTTTQALRDVLKDTGWKVSDDTEYNGTRTTSWTSYQSRFDVLKQLTTTYKMVIDFHIDLDSRKVKSRYVSLKEPKPLFKGKEIVRGKDLLGLKRTVDVSEVRTALICLGPEKENGERIKLIVQDDEAQKQFGLPTRYIWDIYEPESEDENMTEQRLRTLGTTQLNKVKSAAVSYEVTSLDIKKAYPHEIIRLGDIVRVKDRDFNPALYVEGEVISETYNPLTNVSVYSFGNYVEYKESDLRAEFTKKLDAIRQKLNDGLTNVNTIVADVVEGKLEYFERKILKGSEPPENPVNDMLWLDTSNPDVAVLRRYWEEQWINATAESAEDIGAITREKALYSELTNTFVNLSIQHSKLLNEMHVVINSEYLVDFDLKEELNTKLDATVSIFNNIKSNLESMTDETASIGKLIDTQTLFLNYRTAMQNLYNVIERAKVAIDERFKLLQSQYTDEKFKEALNNVADKLGLTVNEDNQLIGEIDVSKQIDESVREMTNQMLRDYVTSSQYQSDQQGIIERLESSDSERKQLADRISDTVTKSEYENDVAQKLSTTKAEVLIEAGQTSNSVSKQVFSAKSKTLERYTSEFINNVSDGMTFRYDENGNIQSHSIGPQGIKIKGDKLDIQLNKEFNLLVSDVAKKADETNIINKINLSREGLDINVNNIGLRGGDSVNYLEIKNNSVLSRGRFTRTWANNTDTANLTLGIRNGYLLVSNEDNGYNLYMTEKGLSTMMNAASGETAGTLEFHYQGYNENSRGVRLHSTYGAVALESDQSRIYTVANLTNNIESRQYGVYIRPFKDTRAGLNEFYFYVKDNDSSSDTDGAILYGNISDPQGQHGAGIRFSKSRTENIVYATNEKGDIGSGDFYASNLYGTLRAKSTNQYALVAYDGEFRVTDKNGASGSSINYRPVRTNELKTTHSYAFSNHSGADVYFGVGMNEMRITDNNFYNGGRTSYKPVRALDFIKSSRAEYKEEIKLWDYDALSVITNDLLLYSYKYKDDNRGLMQHGPVIGDGYKTPTEFIFGDGINTNEMVSWALRAIQQLNEKLEALKNERTS
ncbi:phage tail spike protein [Staphylococcus chromogenes]|uniref:phage tail spike protein n=1 Tax=Staphylococcus chromogenes TaxID=46126 RepID=UPI000D02EE4D|nr:phage tail spike protein [Staphylococcus chromogenes]